jgi:hypothetical protein
VFFNVKIDVFTVRKLADLSSEFFCIEIDPGRNGMCRVCFYNCFEFFVLTALVGYSDNVAGFEQDGRDVGLVAIKGIVTVSYELASFFSGRSKTCTVNNVVETAFENSEKVFTSLTSLFAGEFEIMFELAFKNTIVSLCLLFCAKLKTVFRDLFTALTVLARSISSAAKCAFRTIASFAFKEELFAFAAAESAYRTCISCHVFLHLQ